MNQFTRRPRQPETGFQNIFARRSRLAGETIPNWRAALSRVRAGTGRAKLLFVGDSTTAGAGAGTAGDYYTGAKANSVPTQLAAVAPAGTPTNLASVFAENGVTVAALAAYDPRLTLTSFGGFGPGNFPNTLGGTLLYAQGVGATLGFAPGVTSDTCTIRFMQGANASAGAFVPLVDGVDAGPVISCAGSPGVATYTFTTPRGLHTFGLRVTDLNVFFIGLECFDSTVPAIDIYNAGFSGGTPEGQTAINPWSALNEIRRRGPHLTVISLGINNWLQNTNFLTFAPAMQAIIDAARVSGDVLLVVPVPSGEAAAPLARQAQFHAAIKTLGEANSLPVVDLIEQFGSWPTANSKNWTFPGDQIHYNARGYAEVAEALKPLIF